jgi:hypothetical protein
MKLTQELLYQAIDFARQSYLDQEGGQKRYNLVLKLAKQCNILGIQGSFARQDLLIAQLSALFLYAGIQIPGGNHEDGGFELAKKFLNENGVDDETIESVKDCLCAVVPPQLPINISGQLLCDSLNSFLVIKNHCSLDDLHFFISGISSGDEKKGKYEGWLNHLENLVFFTDPAKKEFDKSIKKKVSWLKNNLSVGENAEELPIAKEKEDSPDIFSEAKPDRGAATLFRNASREHIAMLSIVHQKSGFLLSFNSILLSVVLSILSTKLTEFPHLLIPTVMLVVTCLGTIIFTILATKPMIIRNRKDPLARDTFNVMFFGHYVHLDWQEYNKQIKVISNNVESTVEVLSKNIYYQGVVLDKKYRLLLIAYKIFLYGLIISVSAFLISFFQ